LYYIRKPFIFRSFATTLPPGEYCDQYGGSLQKGKCTGRTISVNKNVCAPGPFQQDTDACAIPIIHNTTVPYLYNAYRWWSQGDKYLDFEGGERGQGTYNGRKAYGTPLAYSTNDDDVLEYQPYNKYGDNYWMVQLLMDCVKTERGWVIWCLIIGMLGNQT
ncbi:hypothetical protein TELCIR_02239, partial [Teladorsagia circumcincta]